MRWARSPGLTDVGRSRCRGEVGGGRHVDHRTLGRSHVAAVGSPVAHNGGVSNNPRWDIAESVAAAVLQRYPGEIHAIGVYGSLAHGDDAEGSDVDLVVVTYRPGTGP